MNTRKKAGRTSLARARKVLTTTELFFFEHAGWSYKPTEETAQAGRLRCARLLALAERVADRLEWSYDWQWDSDADLSWMPEDEQNKPHEVLGCILKDAEGNSLDSLWGIVDADSNYRRVIEAELADTALDHLNRMRVSAFVEPITA